MGDHQKAASLMLAKEHLTEALVYLELSNIDLTEDFGLASLDLETMIKALGQEIQALQREDLV
jgi:hypothetical protein